MCFSIMDWVAQRTCKLKENYNFVYEEGEDYDVGGENPVEMCFQS